MKRLIFGGMSVLLLTATTAPVVRAQQTALEPATLTGRTSNRELQPFKLTDLAYQGAFKEQGIPGYGALIAAYRSGRVSAETLVKSAIAANRLSAEALNDRGYLNAVDIALRELDSSGGRL